MPCNWPRSRRADALCLHELRVRTTAVEINPSVIAACRQWFRLPRTGLRLTVLNQDARQWVDDPPTCRPWTP